MTDPIIRDLISIIWELRRKGHWLESGTIEVEGNLWSYKFQQLKKKPSKTKEKERQL